MAHISGFEEKEIPYFNLQSGKCIEGNEKKQSKKSPNLVMKRSSIQNPPLIESNNERHITRLRELRSQPSFIKSAKMFKK